MENLAYTIEIRKIKNPRLEFKNGQLFVIVPYKLKFNIPAFLQRHKNWIAKHASFFKSIEQQSSSLELKPRLFSDFSAIVEELIKSYSTDLNFFPKEIKFKTWKSKWGSCSKNGVITLNLKLRYFPNELISYVVFHEMIHLVVKAHNQKFYKFLKSKFPNHKQLDKDLVAYDHTYKKSLKLL